jgi:hypothetical protein
MRETIWTLKYFIFVICSFYYQIDVVKINILISNQIKNSMIQEPQLSLIDLKVRLQFHDIKADSELFQVLFSNKIFLYYIGNI